MSKFKLALIQLDTQGDIEKNKSEIESYVQSAAASGAQMVILPEHSDAIDRHPRRFATKIPGEFSEFYSSLAKKYKLILHCGSMTETSDTDRPYNTSLVFDEEGRQIALYRKLHMFDVNIEGGMSIQESRGVEKGDRISVVDTRLCRMGLSICYDIRFGELYRLMALNGAELLVVSANFTDKTGRAHWEPLLRARAIENGCYVAAANQCGDKFNFKAYGHSMLIDPNGKIISELEQEPGMILDEIDTKKTAAVRAQIPVIKNIRNDIYNLNSDYIHIYRKP